MTPRLRLEQLRTHTLDTLAALATQLALVTAARADANGDDEHDPEGATVAFERSQTDALRTAAAARLQEIDAALRRLDDGRYGRCRVCGEPITPGRLAARPFATTCIRHA